MVHFYVLNPAHKLCSITRWLFKGSRRILKQVNASSVFSGVSQVEEPVKRAKVNILDLIQTDLPQVPQSTLIRDVNYYKEDFEGGFCIFRVESTLFKVHKCFLLRESSAFGDMFSLPAIPGIQEGLSDDSAIPLSDTAEQFQDLLWALYALPSQLYSVSEIDSLPLERVLNVAELAHKYCIASYEDWALERLLLLAQSGHVSLRQASSALHARALNIAALSDHKPLLDALTQRLIPRILWSDMDRRPILDIAGRHGLSKLQGVIHYKELIAYERAAYAAGHKPADYPLFPSEVDSDPQRRQELLAAHHSLLNLWECIKANPPHFMEPHDCPTHLDCLATWSDLWTHAAEAQQTERLPTADVLGRLKAMMILLKKALRESEGISLGCSLAALESITVEREDIVAGLMSHFQQY